MGYRPQVKSSKRSRGRQRSPHEKKKTKGKKHRSSGKYLLEESPVPSMAEVAEKTLSRLHSLGNQIFAVFPFNVYFDGWLVNLKDVLITFESSSNISADEQFTQECAKVLADVEHQLEERRRKEVSVEEAIKSISAHKILLQLSEEEYTAKTRVVEGQRNSELARLNNSIEGFRKDLADLAMVKAGLFRAMSKKAKAQKEAEITQKLNATQNELESVVQNSAVEQESLRKEHETKKQLAIEQMEELQKKIEGSEIDASLEDRRVACEALVNAVNALLQRMPA